MRPRLATSSARRRCRGKAQARASSTAAASVQSRVLSRSAECRSQIVEPSVWKRQLHLNGGDKEQSRLLVLQKFPRQHALLARKRDHNRAEAILLPVWGTMQ